MVFGSDEGKEVLEDLGRYCGVEKSSFVVGQPDAVAFNEGKRLVYLHIVALMRESDESVQRAQEAMTL